MKKHVINSIPPLTRNKYRIHFYVEENNEKKNRGKKR